jgi:hypothetical protein
MEPRYITWNFANLITINLMVGVMAAIVILLMRWTSAKAV